MINGPQEIHQDNSKFLTLRLVRGDVCPSARVWVATGERAYVKHCAPENHKKSNAAARVCVNRKERCHTRHLGAVGARAGSQNQAGPRHQRYRTGTGEACGGGGDRADQTTNHAAARVCMPLGMSGAHWGYEEIDCRSSYGHFCVCV